MSDVSPGKRGTSDRAEPPGAEPAGAVRAPRAQRRPGPAQDKLPPQPPGAPPQPPGVARPLYVTGLVAALWCIGIGLAVLTTVTLIGWIAAPKTALGHGMSGVFRTAVNFWLVSHHAGFSTSHGRVGLLPLGLLVLPGALLYRGGGWMIRGLGLPARPRVAVMHVAAALSVPYAALNGMLALAASSSAVRPSAWQALIACFLVAVIAGGLGAARAVVAAQVAAEAKGERLRSGLGALLRLLPDRPRSLVIGVAGSLAVLLASGALLVGGSLAMNMPDADGLYDILAPGIVGGVLLLVVELAFLPNAVIWGMAYAIGPGFSVGGGTSVSATGVFLDTVPAFPPLAALPEPGPAPAISLLALAAPFVAGGVGGVLTIRSLPSPAYEGAPLWGFLSGALTGAVVALLAALSGGPLGGGRMATVGPSAWQIGLMAALEVGISAAIAAWAANWMILRRPPDEPSRPAKERKVRRRAKSETAGRAAKRTAGRAARKARPEAPAAPAAMMPMAAPVPDETSNPRDEASASPAPRPSPYAPNPLEFEEAEPVLAPRRPARARVRGPLPDLAEETPAPPPPAPPPPPPSDGTVVLEGHIMDEPDTPEYPEPAAADPVPPPREDPERTENRGGAIYVLREEPKAD
ncbi:cell division protein PerM [Actinomadura macra]|uniref:cell division protein PerM n=1 Tax=Actinomadura macra TaxID=46164 RepID=UPI001FE23BAA|nr:DUF6350 family protein [Actinomadura macra]